MFGDRFEDQVEDFGVYVHVPFCSHRCDYCAFAAWDDRSHLVDAYLAALARDIGRAVERGQLHAATSVFVGGGTPSLVDPHALGRVLDEIPLAGGAEVTVECNPETVTGAHVDAYLAHGVNRLSFGVQSMVPHVLESLGRRHDPAAVHRAVALARAADVSFNVDLIYGAVGESVGDWERTLEEALALEPSHVSAYALTVEEGTPLAADAARHPDDDDQARKYELADERLRASGRPWYEISNWALPGHECRHNQLYWRQGDYLGFGCAAHSHVAGRRWWNLRTPERYVSAVKGDRPTEAAGEELDASARHVEGLQLAIRTAAGVPSEALRPSDRAELAGLVHDDGTRVVLTRRGRLLANEVAIRLR